MSVLCSLKSENVYAIILYANIIILYANIFLLLLTKKPHIRRWNCIKCFAKSKRVESTPSQVIAPFISKKYFLVLLCADEIAGAAPHLIVSHMPHWYLDLWLCQVKHDAVWNCSVSLAPVLFLRGSWQRFFPHAFPPFHFSHFPFRHRPPVLEFALLESLFLILEKKKYFRQEVFLPCSCGIWVFEIRMC